MTGQGGQGLSGQLGGSQTQGLSWEVAGGAEFQCRVEARLSGALISPEPWVTREPRALGLRKQTGHRAAWQGPQGHLPALPHPRGPEAQAEDALPAHLGPWTLPGPWVPPFMLLHYSSHQPSRVCSAAACPGEGPPSGREKGRLSPLGRWLGRVGAGELERRRS